jgi:hypothetical protein
LEAFVVQGGGFGRLVPEGALFDDEEADMRDLPAFRNFDAVFARERWVKSPQGSVSEPALRRQIRVQFKGRPLSMATWLYEHEIDRARARLCQTAQHAYTAHRSFSLTCAFTCPHGVHSYV